MHVLANAGALALSVAMLAPTGVGGAHADVADRPYRLSPPERCASVTTPRDHAAPLDGFHIGHVPAGVGAASDFAYEWEDVGFATRVWESTSPVGSVVDLQVAVVRGARLSDVESLRTFLAEYHEQDPATWGREPLTANGKPGFRTDAQAVWLAEPGLAVSVKVDRGRFSDADLIATTCGITASAEGGVKRGGGLPGREGSDPGGGT